MNYLFIDGSETKTFVQAGKADKFVFFEFDTNRNLGARITEIADETMAKAGFTKKEVQLYAVCTGPGSLTGLRVAGSFLRTSAFISGKQLVGIDTFSWSAATLQAIGKTGKVRLMVPTLIDKAFALEVDLDTQISKFKPEPILIDDRKPVEGMPNYGIRWHSDGIEKVTPDPEVLHKMMQMQANKTNMEFAEILKVLPMYVIPSQAERKLQEKEC